MKNEIAALFGGVFERFEALEDRIEDLETEALEDARPIISYEEVAEIVSRNCSSLAWSGRILMELRQLFGVE